MVGAAERVRRSRDQDVASTYVLRPHMGTGVSCYFGRSEWRGVRNGVWADGELSWGAEGLQRV